MGLQSCFPLPEVIVRPIASSVEMCRQAYMHLYVYACMYVGYVSRTCTSTDNYVAFFKSESSIIHISPSGESVHS